MAFTVAGDDAADSPGLETLARKSRRMGGSVGNRCIISRGFPPTGSPIFYAMLLDDGSLKGG